MAITENSIAFGSIWRLGRHYLACGSSSNPSMVRELYRGYDRSPLIITDVPYAAGASSDSHRKKPSRQRMMGANMSQRAQERLFNRVFGTSAADAAYVMCDWRLWSNLTDVLEQYWPLRNMIVLDKPIGLGSLWRSGHELCAYCARESDPRRVGIPAVKNVLELPRVRDKQHPFEKPVDLLKDILRVDDYVRPGVDVYDPFAGSCSLLIAAEEMGRRSFNVELDPRFVKVGIRRWEMETGQKAEEVARVG